MQDAKNGDDVPIEFIDRDVGSDDANTRRWTEPWARCAIARELGKAVEQGFERRCVAQGVEVAPLEARSVMMSARSLSALAVMTTRAIIASELRFARPCETCARPKSERFRSRRRLVPPQLEEGSRRVRRSRYASERRSPRQWPLGPQPRGSGTHRTRLALRASVVGQEEGSRSCAAGYNQLARIASRCGRRLLITIPTRALAAVAAVFVLLAHRIGVEYDALRA